MRNIKNETREAGASERLTCYAMRVIGLVLTAAGAFFLWKDYPSSAIANGFFAATTLLGLATAVGGWLPVSTPEQRSTSLQPERVRTH